jgi:hypothetical protein
MISLLLHPKENSNGSRRKAQGIEHGVRSKRSEVRNQRSEVGSQTTDGSKY